MSGVDYAADWFQSEVLFRRLCGDAQSRARSASAQEFAREMVLAANAKGLEAPVTEAQMKYLCMIAGVVMPRRLKR